MREDIEPGRPASACTQCGRCCTNADYMGSLRASGEDVKRWRRQGRDDILAYADIMGGTDDPWADLWISPKTANDVYRCPFVRKIRGSEKYRCRIYDTRPQICRDYVPFAPNSICE